MKKIVLLFIVIMLNLTVTAQHLKFMGIPIDGNINTFASKLASKGFVISPRNKTAGAGLRIMKGHFFDQSAELWVSYTPSTKNVYSVRVVFWSDDKDVCESFVKEIKRSIEDKYDYTDEEGKTMGGDDITIYNIYYDSVDYSIGDIYVGIADDNSYYGYIVNLTYEDRKNRYKNDNAKSNDI